MKMGLRFVLLLALLEWAQAAQVPECMGMEPLCAGAKLILKGEVGESRTVLTREGVCAVWEVKALSTLKGSVQPGSVIRVAGLEEYHKRDETKGSRQEYPRLAKGDVVYLFLVPRGTPMDYTKYDLTDAEWKVIESGVRLVVGDKVHDFGTYYNANEPVISGPVPKFVEMTLTSFPETPIISVPAFEKQVGEAGTKEKEAGQ